MPSIQEKRLLVSLATNRWTPDAHFGAESGFCRNAGAVWTGKSKKRAWSFRPLCSDLVSPPGGDGMFALRRPQVHARAGAGSSKMGPCHSACTSTQARATACPTHVCAPLLLLATLHLPLPSRPSFPLLPPSTCKYSCTVFVRWADDNDVSE